ncbi:MAG TPA: zf-HC2 domain-containing protein [Pyrinomonadaceae bacterium]|nr:zf-HC2 domain-containing protein [Pyrinomonadaceae bacterium]
MNCEKCQDLISDFLDGSLSLDDHSTLNSHLEECLGCADVRHDLESLVGFCRTQRGQYSAPPNEQAMWLRIRNVIESEPPAVATAPVKTGGNFWTNWISRSWELSFAQLSAAAAIMVLVVSLTTVVGVRRWQSGGTGSGLALADDGLNAPHVKLKNRLSQQQQTIAHWNQRVDFNKARWNPQMRETFERNLKVIDEAVNDSFEALSRNPHDEVSEEMLNAALNEKLSLLKEFAEL